MTWGKSGGKISGTEKAADLTVRRPFLSESTRKSALRDRTHGARTSASAAIDAGISIDLVLAVALRNSADGALALAGTAADASIANYMSHW